MPIPNSEAQYLHPNATLSLCQFIFPPSWLTE
uniref:Uncharacterized protein n=1 Tax=Setaria italica TaxID=4555 RepID=K3Y4I6_SETIT